MDAEQLINLASLLNGAEGAVETACERLSNDGFCFLSLSPESHVSGRVRAAASTSSAFFSSPDEVKAKSGLGDVGYAAVPDAPCPRQCLRLVSGRFAAASTSRLPDPRPFSDLAATLDLVSAQLASVLSPRLFGCDLEGLASKAPVPLVGGPGAAEVQTSPADDDAPRGWGLLDVVLYTPGQRRSGAGATDVVVSEHADPGLFSLEVYESTPGMEFRDRTGAWRRTPEGAMALWTGSAAVEASGGALKPGWHRVVVPTDSGTPRLAIWHEAATNSQLSAKSFAALSAVVDAFAATARSSAPGAVRRSAAVMGANNADGEPIEFLVKFLTGRYKKFAPFYLTSTYMDLKERIQSEEGVQPSKMRLAVKGPNGVFIPDDSDLLGKELGSFDGQKQFVAFLILQLRGSG